MKALTAWTTLFGILVITALATEVTAEVELDDLLSFAYDSDLVAASEADRIAWVSNERGVRNLWTASAPDFEAVKLTDYRDDDGQTIGSLRLTADGGRLVYVRGGGPNVAGEIPNPTSDPEGAERAIWVVATDGGEPRRLAEGAGPVLSPNDTVVFARGGQVLEVPLEPSSEEEASEPMTLFKARGGLGGLAWSPDGERLAFVSSRGTHGFIGVFDRGLEKITWIAPSVDRDSAPVWSPDGKRLAFIRQLGLMIGELLDITSGNPFALWIGDPKTGKARQIWSSPGDDGGFAQFYPNQSLAWAAGDRLVFASEHDGWLHHYSIAVDGGEAIDLTPGAGFAPSASLSADGATLFFAANHGDSPRRHVWRVPTSGGTPELLTPGRGIETDPVPLASGKTLAFRIASAQSPQAVAVMPAAGGDQRRISPALTADFPEYALVVPEPVTFRASDGLEIHGQLFLPPGAAADDDRPAVLFMHGGPIRQMLVGFHYSGYYTRCYAFNQYLASRGTVVLSVNFRSGVGYGRDFRRAAEQGPRGASEYRDIVAAGRWLRQRPEVDPERIGLWGGSYGGYLTAMGLARDSDLFAAGVDLHGVHDWAHRGRAFPTPGGAWALRGEELLDVAYRSSPVADLSYWSSPVLFVHGDDDRNVQFIQTTDLVRRLRARDVHVETLIFPDEVHGFLRHESWLRTFRAAADFFDRFLGFVH